MLSSWPQSPPLPTAHSWTPVHIYSICPAPMGGEFCRPQSKRKLSRGRSAAGRWFPFPFPLPWSEDTLVQPSPGPAGLWTLYLHRECPGHPWSGGVPASSAAHSCLSPPPLWAEPQVRLSPGSASVSVGFSSSPAGFAWLPVGCFWGLGVCSRTLRNDAQIKEKAASGRTQLYG